MSQERQGADVIWSAIAMASAGPMGCSWAIGYMGLSTVEHAVTVAKVVMVMLGLEPTHLLLKESGRSTHQAIVTSLNGLADSAM